MSGRRRLVRGEKGFLLQGIGAGVRPEATGPWGEGLSPARGSALVSGRRRLVRRGDGSRLRWEGGGPRAGGDRRRPGCTTEGRSRTQPPQPTQARGSYRVRRTSEILRRIARPRALTAAALLGALAAGGATGCGGSSTQGAGSADGAAADGERFHLGRRPRWRSVASPGVACDFDGGHSTGRRGRGDSGQPPRTSCIGTDDPTRALVHGLRSACMHDSVAAQVAGLVPMKVAAEVASPNCPFVPHISRAATARRR